MANTIGSAANKKHRRGQFHVKHKISTNCENCYEQVNETKYLIPDAGKEKSHYQQKLKTELKLFLGTFSNCY